ncbi:PEP-CTERM sorting domain-containing protein [Ruficoccus sp. ZRK36]|uniref:PEP-CTERM sorting domain-containing protein n=1 Tax=Ruficoccus sp. ZRK36 TaxID=2866311 RepID=UPI001C737402|nr:PEP-CTERM sorting domain-containing protein [Ruficoccus sp. ZRK36]QYY34803.1 PEP-CTERM sorting domain-containing protein [Ruficoccus sp. ZRK36]
MSYVSFTIARKLGNLAAVLVLLLCLLSTKASAEISLVVTGPDSIEAGDDFTIYYTITWDEGDILPENPAIGFSSNLMAFPAYFGSKMEIESSNTLPNDLDLTVEWDETGYLSSGDHQWQVVNYEIIQMEDHREYIYTEIVDPITLIVAQHISTDEDLPDGTYRFTIDTDPNDTFVYLLDDTNISYDHIQEFYLNVGPQVPEPSTYAAAVGLLTLLATVLIRRRCVTRKF